MQGSDSAATGRHRVKGEETICS